MLSRPREASCRATAHRAAKAWHPATRRAPGVGGPTGLEWAVARRALRQESTMSARRFQTLVLSLLVLGPAPGARAGFPTPEPPIPQRVALADAVVVGRVAAVEA